MLKLDLDSRSSLVISEHRNEEKKARDLSVCARHVVRHTLCTTFSFFCVTRVNFIVDAALDVASAIKNMKLKLRT